MYRKMRRDDVNSTETRFLELLEEHKLRILRFCSIYADTRADREDLFQEILFNVWKSLPSFREQSSVTTWLYRVSLRVSVRFAQGRARRRGLDVRLTGVELSPATGKSGADELDRKERVRRLRGCIRDLPEADRLIVTLHLEDLPHREIGEVAGITENHVAVKLKRIKARLASCMKERP